MKPEIRDSIIRILDEHRLMTLATVRPDGWPQATVVSYVNDGLTLYCFVARLGQKFANIKREPRVSVAIAGEFSDTSSIRGLSLAARAALVEDKSDYERMTNSFLARFPEYGEWPRPNPAFAPLLKLTPEVVSVVDYSKGFGHSDLVTIPRQDIQPQIKSRRHNWFANIVGR
jgi:nitroimidazol reductase NimA-like FMN-containing flavoprotein (pyridoxamine 5'-phosphate oxidase superfamily)